MSMAILSVLQVTGIAAAYFSVTLLLPYLFLRKKLAGFGTVPVRLMAYFLTGNFYIINLVYLLQLLHISCWFTLVLGTLTPFFVTAYMRYRGSFFRLLEEKLGRILLVLGGETGRKTLFLRMGKKTGKISKKLRKRWKDYFRTHGPDIFLTAGIMVLLLYMYGSSVVSVYGYCASDVVLHNYWINAMDSGHIFVDGVYPFGLHCLLYYVHTVFTIPVYIILRLFYVIQALVVHFMLLAFLKAVCRSRYAPYIGIIIYIVSSRFYEYTYIRYYATLPQEFGMAFILPAAYFAMAFLQQRKEVQTEDAKRCLGLFAVSVSLTLAVHFYDTIIAGLFCVAIGAGFVFRVFRWRYFRKIVAAGVLGIMLAVLPLAAAYVTGTPLQASLNWGMSQLKQSSDSPKEKPDGEKKEELTILETVLDRMEYYVAYDMKTAQIMLGSIGVLFLLGLLWFILRRAEYGGVLVSVSIYMAVLAVLQASAQLGLMQILEVSRYSVYLGYGIPIVWSLCVDAVIYLLVRKEKALNICSFTALAAACVVTAQTGMRAPVKVSAYETNEAVTCLSNIIRENKNKAWTICSANDERQMLGGYKNAYHYEMIKFLKDMRSFDDDTSITIPTESVYFFIEKIPILYRDYINTEKPDRLVSVKGAKEPVSEKPGILPYIGDDRWVTMSHMYYWAQAFKELYPNEMEVYYETDNFICYRVRQNGYSLYNFAIDYGYNGIVEKKED
ncbi:hypothetical protein AALA78_07860 [Lachnospiraceae bacterium 42-17]